MSWLDNINIIGRSWLSVQHSKSQLIWEHQQRNQIFDICNPKIFLSHTNTEWLRPRRSAPERWITFEDLFSEQGGVPNQQRCEVLPWYSSLLSLPLLQFKKFTIPTRWKISFRWVFPFMERRKIHYCSEFVLNHLHSSHKHRRFNGDSLDMTMVVPQVEVEQNSNTIRWHQSTGLI